MWLAARQPPWLERPFPKRRRRLCRSRGRAGDRPARRWLLLDASTIWFYRARARQSPDHGPRRHCCRARREGWPWQRPEQAPEARGRRSPLVPERPLKAVCSDESGHVHEEAGLMVGIVHGGHRERPGSAMTARTHRLGDERKGARGAVRTAIVARASGWWSLCYSKVRCGRGHAVAGPITY